MTTEPIIIAEAGINHGGSLDKAKLLVDLANDTGADYVKFHYAIADRMLTPDKHNSLWNDRHPQGSEDLRTFVKKVELHSKDFIELKKYAENKDIKIMLSCYDMPSIEDSIKIGIRDIKLASCDIIKDDYIHYLNEHADTFVLATGMATMEEIDHAVSISRPEKMWLLHCISEYPMPDKLANLNFITTLKKRYNVRVGFSDHTADYVIPLLAVYQGADMIEKHFMIEGDTTCCDANVSIDPTQMKKLVYFAKNRNAILGSGNREMSPKEWANRDKYRNRWK